MRNIKDKILSLRVSSNEFDTIKQKAEISGMYVSRYMVESALSERGLSISQKQQIYYHLSKIKDAARYPEDNKIQIIEECSAIWQLLNL